MVSVLQDWWLVYRCEGLQKTWLGFWSWFLQNRKACQKNKNIHWYTYCARQMVSHEIQLQHYATWLKRHLTDSRYNGLPKEPRQFLHKYGSNTCLSQQPPAYRWCKSWDVGNILVVWVDNLRWNSLNIVHQQSQKNHVCIFVVMPEAFYWLFDLFLRSHRSQWFLLGPCSFLFLFRGVVA